MRSDKTSANRLDAVVGQLLHELPATDRPFVFTKSGLAWNENDRVASPQRVLKPESIRRECEASLRAAQGKAEGLGEPIHVPGQNSPRARRIEMKMPKAPKALIGANLVWMHQTQACRVTRRAG